MLVFDHTSVLKLIEWRWGLRPLTPRDASADVHNLAYTLDFDRPQTAVPVLPKPHTPLFVWPCFANLFSGFASADAPKTSGGTSRAPVSSAQKTAVLQEVRAMAEKNGFNVQ